jgi:hypothetical protein
MLSNPSNVQSESTEVIESNHDDTLTLGSSEYPVQHPSIAKPISDTSTGPDGQDERSDMEDRPEFFDDAPSDEDMDMPDGGAALTMTLSHAEQLNAELDMLDAEVMGSDNLVGLLMENHYQPTMIENLPFSYHGYNQGPQNFAQDSDVYDGNTIDNELESAPAAIPNLPVAMSAVALGAVAQQLQHIQNGQGHDNFTIVPDAQHGGVQDNSTLPFLYHPQFSMIPLNFGGDSHINVVSLAGISPHQPAVTLGSQNTPHLWGTEGWTPSPAMDDILVSSQDQLNASHFPSSDAIGLDNDQVTNADQDPVDDQFNLSFAEFLHSWAHSSSREGDARKPSRGPTLPAIESQREMKTTGPMRRNDLQGERCDIQRINWAELGVSRLEARQMRRQTYTNYTNLRTHLQWHVSI